MRAVRVQWPPSGGKRLDDDLGLADHRAARGVVADADHARVLGDIEPAVVQIDAVRTVETGQQVAGAIATSVAVAVRLEAYDPPRTRDRCDELAAWPEAKHPHVRQALREAADPIVARGAKPRALLDARLGAARPEEEMADRGVHRVALREERAAGTAHERQQRGEECEEQERGGAAEGSRPTAASGAGLGCGQGVTPSCGWRARRSRVGAAGRG